MNRIERLKELIDQSHYIVFFGGAGVSTESNIPDFRSVDGLYHQKWEYPPETILSRGFFEKNPKEFYRFYKEKILLDDCKPNYAHYALAKLEKEGKLKAVITQNIDGLHQTAGSKAVYELHGGVRDNYCVKCKKYFDETYVKMQNDVPYCDSCNGIIKPYVILYGEGLDMDVIHAAIHHILQADLLIVGGTSLTVYPAAGLLNYYKGRDVVLINRDATSLDSEATLVFREKIGEVLGRATGLIS